MKTTIEPRHICEAHAYEYCPEKLVFTVFDVDEETDTRIEETGTTYRAVFSTFIERILDHDAFDEPYSWYVTVKHKEDKTVLASFIVRAENPTTETEELTSEAQYMYDTLKREFERPNF